jgi:hypothetical protein
MNSLTPDSLDVFLRRFYALNDGVIRRIEFAYQPSGTRQATVILSSQDSESPSGWSNLLLRFDAVSEFVLREGRSTCQILSEGVSIKWIRETLFISLSSSMDGPESLDDFRQSDCYAACDAISWEIMPYAE